MIITVCIINRGRIEFTVIESEYKYCFDTKGFMCSPSIHTFGGFRPIYFTSDFVCL